MADVRIILWGYRLDDPPEVVPADVSFTLESKTSAGGFGRIGRGIIHQAILPAAVAPAPGLGSANSGFVA